MTPKRSLMVPTTGAQGRDGAVLVVVVLLGLAMFALAHGLLVGARSALVTARVGARLEEARVSADGALDRALGTGPGPWRDSVAPGASISYPDTTSAEYPVAVTWRRLSSELWLVEARRDDERGDRTLARVARIAWAIDPLTRLEALPATVSVGAGAPVSIAGTLASPDLVEEEEHETSRGTEGPCIRWWDQWRDSIPASAPLGVAPDAVLGPLSLSTLRSTVAMPEGLEATPGPRVAGGACDTSHGENWGDPISSDAPCSEYFGLVGGEGPLVIVGGVGQGVLVVDGDVELTEGARFFGLIVASGALRLGGGAVVEGFVVARGGVQIASGGEVRRSVCRGLRALNGVQDRLPKGLPLHGALDYGPR